VATVSDGVVRGISAGTAVITATSVYNPDASDSCVVMVSVPPLTLPVSSTNASPTRRTSRVKITVNWGDKARLPSGTLFRFWLLTQEYEAGEAGAASADGDTVPSGTAYLNGDVLDISLSGLGIDDGMYSIYFAAVDKPAEYCGTTEPLRLASTVRRKKNDGCNALGTVGIGLLLVPLARLTKRRK
ncbi:MAG: hypothetical protein LBR38_04695, partial [Synergistaceae bacterium]|jgi:hypothetical protein|nr:hypothetical protein [Synergistaceae bacterium]